MPFTPETEDNGYLPLDQETREMFQEANAVHDLEPHPRAGEQPAKCPDCDHWHDETEREGSREGQGIIGCMWCSCGHYAECPCGGCYGPGGLELLDDEESKGSTSEPAPEPKDETGATRPPESTRPRGSGLSTASPAEPGERSGPPSPIFPPLPGSVGGLDESTKEGSLCPESREGESGESVVGQTEAAPASPARLAALFDLLEDDSTDGDW